MYSYISNEYQRHSVGTQPQCPIPETDIGVSVSPVITSAAFTGIGEGCLHLEELGSQNESLFTEGSLATATSTKLTTKQVRGNPEKSRSRERWTVNDAVKSQKGSNNKLPVVSCSHDKHDP